MTGEAPLSLLCLLSLTSSLVPVVAKIPSVGEIETKSTASTPAPKVLRTN